jgi:hypothetical protein
MKNPFYQVGKMSLFILGLMVGCCMGVFLITLLANFKEADAAAIRFMEERERVTRECLPVTHQSIT